MKKKEIVHIGKGNKCETCFNEGKQETLKILRERIEKLWGYNLVRHGLMVKKEEVIKLLDDSEAEGK